MIEKATAICGSEGEAISGGNQSWEFPESAAIVGENTESWHAVFESCSFTL